MLKNSRVFAILFAVLAAGMITAPIMVEASSNQSLRSVNFVAHLSGKEWISRVDPAVTYTINTLAQGQVIFHLSKDGTELSYKVIVANIENVTMAHIHLDTGVALGPIVVWLYPKNPPPQLIPGRTDGILAQGTITSADLVGPLSGKSLNDLLAEIENGHAYVVLHTSQHPPGEIRGWVM